MLCRHSHDALVTRTAAHSVKLCFIHGYNGDLALHSLRYQKLYRALAIAGGDVYFINIALCGKKLAHGVTAAYYALADRVGKLTSRACGLAIGLFRFILISVFVFHFYLHKSQKRHLNLLLPINYNIYF